MTSTFSRRNLMKLASAILPIKLMNLRLGVPGPDLGAPGPRPPVADSFPSHPAELVQEMVLVSHFDLKRVKELVEARPSLARAAWDWGFGDWESALGAASHMGKRPIAEFLIEKGARPSLFSAAMLGQIDVVRAFVAAQPGVQRIRGPHSISLLAHAKAGGSGASKVYEFLQGLGDADSEAEAPLSDEERTHLVGTYAFGLAANQVIDVKVENGSGLTNQLTWTRKGTIGRPLYHLGQRVFYPAGAPNVHIRFAEESDAIVMTVNDSDVVVTARRKTQVAK